MALKDHPIKTCCLCGKDDHIMFIRIPNDPNVYEMCIPCNKLFNEKILEKERRPEGMTWPIDINAYKPS